MGERGKKGRLIYGCLLYKSGKNKWVWRYVDPKGIRRDRSTGTSNEAEAMRIARKWAAGEQAIREGIIKISVKPDLVSLQEAATAFFDETKLQRAAGTIEMISIHLDTHILPFFSPGINLTEISVSDIKRFRKYLLNGRNLKPVTINKILSTLSGIFKNALEEEWIETMPFIKRLSEEEEEHGYVFEMDEIERILAAAREHSHITLRYVACGLFCGMRHSDAVNSRWDYLELWDDAAEDQAVVGLIHLRHQKNRKAVPRPMLRQAWEIFQEVPLSERRGYLINYWEENEGEDRPVKKMRRQ